MFLFSDEQQNNSNTDLETGTQMSESTGIESNYDLRSTLSEMSIETIKSGTTVEKVPSETIVQTGKHL